MVTKIRKNSKILEGRFSFSRCSVAKVSRFKKCPRTDGFTRVSARITTRAGGRIPFSCVIFSSSPLSFFFFFFLPFRHAFSVPLLYFAPSLCVLLLFSPFLLLFFFLFFVERERREKPANSLCSAGSFVAETESRPDRRANEASIVPFCFLIQRDASEKQRDELTTLKNDEFSGHCTEMLGHARAGVFVSGKFGFCFICNPRRLFLRLLLVAEHSV